MPPKAQVQTIDYYGSTIEKKIQEDKLKER
jgi:hypothetical protein